MKKKVFFLIISILFIFLTTKVYAKTYSFYEGEKVDNSYIIKEYSDTTDYFLTSKIIRERDTNQFVYCIDPFIYFKGENIYSESSPTVTKAQLERIEQIAHYGYGYKDHTDKIWYSVAQVMIWRTILSDSRVYFTETLNGQKTNKYDDKINEINNLINSNNKLPSFSNNTIDLVEGNSLNLLDTNNVLNNYKVDNNIVKIESNKLVSSNLKEGIYTINLIRNDNTQNSGLIFYTSEGSQTLIKPGDILGKNTSLKIKVSKTNLTINKLDEDTNTCNPNKESFLTNTKYELYDSNNKLVKELTINDKCNTTISNLNYGKYTVKEIEPGLGYIKDDNTYTFELNKNNTNIVLNLKNKVISKNITIYKTYGKKNNQIPEANIEFNIYDKDKELVDTIKTDENGNTTINLKYGTYTIKQINTHDGYELNDEFEIEVKDTNDETINLEDLKIEVPETYIPSKLEILIKKIKKIIMKIINILKI